MEFLKVENLVFSSIDEDSNLIVDVESILEKESPQLLTY